MTAYVHDGIAFDLTRRFVDVVGVEWRWTGDWTPAGEPLLSGAGVAAPVPLPTVYHDHGPLIPLAKPLPHDVIRAAVTGNFNASIESGLTESYEDWALRTAKAAR